MIKIGTDCSGIEAPIQALIKLKVPFIHEFSCEIDPYAKKSILANYNPKILFDDITKKRKLPKVDIYVAGPSCQSFSMAGNRLGSLDKRSNLFYYCINAIKECNPKVFILENVKGLISIENGHFFNDILKKLETLKDYDIAHKVLNTRHYGIPQNRERLFIVGILKSELKCPFTWPINVKSKNIRDYIDTTDTHKDVYPQFCIQDILKQKGTFVNISYINYTNPESYQDYAPTITTAGSMIMCIPMHRKANIKELLTLQGFNPKFKQVVSDSQLKKQIGNSISVNVLEHLFKSIFKCVKF